MSFCVLPRGDSAWARCRLFFDAFTLPPAFAPFATPPSTYAAANTHTIHTTHGAELYPSEPPPRAAVSVGAPLTCRGLPAISPLPMKLFNYWRSSASYRARPALAFKKFPTTNTSS